MRRIYNYLIPFFIFLTPKVFAAEEISLDSGDTAWMLISTALVMFMIPGLALFYGGLVRKKNVLSAIMHSFIALAVMTIQWVILGYSLSFGTDVGSFIGNFEFLFLKGITYQSNSGTIPTYVFIMFQGMFAGITPALISGSIAERVRFVPYVIFILLWGTFVYDPICHWVWGGGWLSQMNALDFAGGTVVHISSGISALVAAILLGKRKGYPSGEFIPHNLTMCLLGAGILWFGWFGFNAGSAVASNHSAGLAFITTHVACCAGVIGWIIAEWFKSKKASALGAASGLVAGLVAITPAAGFVTPMSAMVIGFLSGFICYRAVLLKSHFGYDDSLDAFGVHGIGGTWGALATGIFVTVGGTGLLNGNVHQLWVQFISVAATMAYAGILTWILIKLIDKTMGFRIVDKDKEEMGIDQTEHGEVGYNF